MNNYVAFYYGEPSYAFEADDLYGAKQKSIAHFKVKKSKQHMISVILANEAISPASL
jgi:hypothetical protein